MLWNAEGEISKLPLKMAGESLQPNLKKGCYQIKFEPKKKKIVTQNQKFCTLFHTKNEEKISMHIHLLPTHVYANT